MIMPGIGTAIGGGLGLLGGGIAGWFNADNQDELDNEAQALKAEAAANRQRALGALGTTRTQNQTGWDNLTTTNQKGWDSAITAQGGRWNDYETKQDTSWGDLIKSDQTGWDNLISKNQIYETPAAGAGSPGSVNGAGGAGGAGGPRRANNAFWQMLGAQQADMTDEYTKGLQNATNAMAARGFTGTANEALARASVAGSMAKQRSAMQNQAVAGQWNLLQNLDVNKQTSGTRLGTGRVQDLGNIRLGRVNNMGSMDLGKLSDQTRMGESKLGDMTRLGLAESSIHQGNANTDLGQFAMAQQRTDAAQAAAMNSYGQLAAGGMNYFAGPGGGLLRDMYGRPAAGVQGDIPGAGGMYFRPSGAMA